MWLKLPDEHADDPRRLELGAAACWLDVAGMLYAARHLTDGVVAERVLTRRLVLDDDIDGAQLLDRLVAADLWHRPGHACADCFQPPDGHVVSHDYLRHNPSKEQAEAKRAARAEAGRRGGRRSGASRRRAAGEANASASAEANASAVVEHADEPRPVPSSSLPEEGGRDGARCDRCDGVGHVETAPNVFAPCPNRCRGVRLAG